MKFKFVLKHDILEAMKAMAVFCPEYYDDVIEELPVYVLECQQDILADLIISGKIKVRIERMVERTDG